MRTAGHIILPEIISKEPLGPLVRHGDNAWGDVVRWVLNGLIIAEEKGITAANVDSMASADTKDPEVKRLLGVEGNYGEIFEKYIGENTAIGLARGLNQLWTKGGILYAPPFR